MGHGLHHPRQVVHFYPYSSIGHNRHDDGAGPGHGGWICLSCSCVPPPPRDFTAADKKKALSLFWSEEHKPQLQLHTQIPSHAGGWQQPTAIVVGGEGGRRRSDPGVFRLQVSVRLSEVKGTLPCCCVDVSISLSLYVGGGAGCRWSSWSTP